MSSNVPAWCYEEARRVVPDLYPHYRVDDGDEDALENVGIIAHAIHAAYLRGLKAAAGKAERFYAGPGAASRDQDIRRDAGRSIAAAIRALARG